jgi:glycosyltransferase involved in cell wall biosynthesis
MASPLVTVLIRSYLSAGTLARAIRSVLSQTFEDLECLVVDDGSTDHTAEVVASIVDARLRYVRLPANLGRAAAAKVGIFEARGAYLGVLDADDWWYSAKLARQLPVLFREPALAFVSTNMILVDDRGEALAVEGCAEPSATLVRLSPLRVPGPAPTPYAPSLFRIEVARATSFDLGIRRAEDFYFMLQILLRHPSAILPEPLYVYTAPERSAYAASAQASRRIYAKYAFQYPVASLYRQSQCLFKQVAYAGAGWLGATRGTIVQRGWPLTASEKERFESARARVEGASRSSSPAVEVPKTER